MNPYNSIINYYKGVVGQLAGGDYTWTIQRPNYSVIDGTGVTISTAAKLFLEPSNLNLAVIKARDIEFSMLVGDPTLFKTGDIIINNQGDFPPNTVMQVPQEEEFLTIKTPNVGRIINNQTVLYSSILFDYAPAYNDGPSKQYEIPTSLTDPRKKICMYTRSGIIEGMGFKDDQTGDIFQISLIEYFNQLMFLHLVKGNESV